MSSGNCESVQGHKGQFPEGGYPMLDLTEVFDMHGPVHGISELQRRSSFPPTPTIDAEIAIEIMRELGQLAPLAELDYKELGH